MLYQWRQEFKEGRFSENKDMRKNIPCEGGSQLRVAAGLQVFHSYNGLSIRQYLNGVEVDSF